MVVVFYQKYTIFVYLIVFCVSVKKMTPMIAASTKFDFLYCLVEPVFNVDRFKGRDVVEIVTYSLTHVYLQSKSCGYRESNPGHTD